MTEKPKCNTTLSKATNNDPDLLKIKWWRTRLIWVVRNDYYLPESQFRTLPKGTPKLKLFNSRHMLLLPMSVFNPILFRKLVNICCDSILTSAVSYSAIQNGLFFLTTLLTQIYWSFLWTRPKLIFPYFHFIEKTYRISCDNWKFKKKLYLIRAIITIIIRVVNKNNNNHVVFFPSFLFCVAR